MTAILTAALPAAPHPSFAGQWVLNRNLSAGAIPERSALNITQDNHWLHMAQTDENGPATTMLESECRTDGRFHPVAGARGGSVSCKWDGATLVMEEHWGHGDRDQRITRTVIDPDGTLVQDVTTNAPAGPARAHLVWTKR